MRARPAEERGGGDLCLRVRATAMPVGGRRYVLLFFQDITTLERLSEVQRTFFHDLRNMLLGLKATAELLRMSANDGERGKLTGHVEKITDDTAREVRLQESLTGDSTEANLGSHVPLRVADVLADVARLPRSHGVAADRRLAFEIPSPGLTVLSDAMRINRVLVNMVVNALEATEPGGTVRVRAERHPSEADATIRFKVWNAGVIPEDVALRYRSAAFLDGRDNGARHRHLKYEAHRRALPRGQGELLEPKPQGTVFSFTLPEGFVAWLSPEPGAEKTGGAAGLAGARRRFGLSDSLEQAAINKRGLSISPPSSPVDQCGARYAVAPQGRLGIGCAVEPFCCAAHAHPSARSVRHDERLAW